MTRAPELLSFLGDLGDTPVERMVAGARFAATFDALEAALSTGAFGGATLIADEPPPVGRDVPAGVTVVVDRRPFAFDERLREAIRERRMDAVVYFGGGSLPLLGADGFREVAAALAGDGIVTNNFYSADLVAVRPASALADVREPFASDNPLPRLLRDATGLPVHHLPRTAATQFDIDSPADLRVLAATGLGGRRLAALVASLPLDMAALRCVMPLFTDRRAEVLVAGRVGSHVWRQIEQETACRVRLLAEERGMQADGRLAAGRVRSILGFHLRSVGERRFFADLAELGDAAFIDYRVLMAHLLPEPGPSRPDRFAADLGRAEDIADPTLRRFVEAAVLAPRPVILGGHSLVSGGLMALIQAAWDQRDRAGAP